MPIRIIDGNPTDSSAGRLFIESDALRLLQREMQRYCDQQVDGRSFLISGHRGAGKTTLVEGALQRILSSVDQTDVRARLSNRRGEVPRLRPLLVRLQGPNLLPPSDDDRSTTDPNTAPLSSAAADGSTNPGVEQKPVQINIGGHSEKPSAQTPPAGPMETVLIQITLGLHRALADAFADAYRKRLERRAGELFEMRNRVGRDSPAAAAYRRVMRDLELAAELELDLDENPGKARLREFWRRAGALYTGILPGSTGNGFNELVALSSSCEAYQRISGTFSRKEENTTGDSRKTETAVTLDAKGSEFLKSISAIFAGGAVGAGLAASHVAGLAPSIFAGLVTALASTAVFRFSTSRARQQAINHSELFIPDLSVASLARLLPVLIMRIQRAGFAPIFVVDELDKVDLSSRITDMVKRLKKFVAEQSFFCFLTDRKYFEELSTRTAEAPYPIEYTYYSHQLFIVYKHTDLHAYLRSVLQPTTPTQPATQAPAATVAAAQNPPAVPALTVAVATDAPLQPGAAERVTPASASDQVAPEGQTPAPGSDRTPHVPPAAVVPVVDDDAIDVQILPYLILHASQMHTIDLRRQLLAIQNDKGEVIYEPGLIRGRLRFRFALMIQLAVETALEQEDMQAEIDFRPSFLQVVRDTLYYISRQWQNAKPLNLDDDTGLKEFRLHLLSRMATEATLASTATTGTVAAKQAEAGQSKTPKQSSDEGTVSFFLRSSEPTPSIPAPVTALCIDPDTVTFLLKAVRSVASALTNVDTVRAGASARGVPKDVLAALPPPDKPLLSQTGPHVYRWHRFPSGRETAGGDAMQAAAPQAQPDMSWQKDAELLKAFEMALGELTGRTVDPALLANQCGLLPTTPSWADTQRAIGRLSDWKAAGTRTPYADHGEDAALLAESRAALQESAAAIELGLVCARVLRKESPFEHVRASLVIIADALRLRETSSNHNYSRLNNILTEIISHVSAGRPQLLRSFPQIAESAAVEQWKSRVEIVSDDLKKGFRPTPTQIESFEETSWSYWENRLQNPSSILTLPMLGPIYCAVNSRAAGNILPFNLESMGIGDWSLVFSAGAGYAHPWLQLAALQHLGFSSSSMLRYVQLLPKRWSDPVAAVQPWQRSDSPEAPGAVILIHGALNVIGWKPQPGFPILAMSEVSDRSLPPEFNSVREALGPIIAVELGSQPSTLQSTVNSGAKSRSSGSDRSPLTQSDRVIIRDLGFDLNGPIPVLVPASFATPDWPPNFRPIVAENPEQFFRAAADVLAPADSKAQVWSSSPQT